MRNHDQGRPELRTARIHVPPPELGHDDVVLVVDELVRVLRATFDEVNGA